ncbi:unknown [Anaerotruncus sp. CAG:390]|nr:unknown [Anaerotruncus sp. CAG:390]
MVKGSKRQIIFLPNLRDAGRGIFECAYFVLRADRGDGDVGENEMLLEAERIVAEAERLHGRDRSAGRGRAERPEKQRRTHGWAAAFVAGLFAGMAAAFLICLVLYILRT